MNLRLLVAMLAAFAAIGLASVGARASDGAVTEVCQSEGAVSLCQVVDQDDDDDDDDGPGLADLLGGGDDDD